MSQMLILSHRAFLNESSFSHGGITGALTSGLDVTGITLLKAGKVLDPFQGSVLQVLQKGNGSWQPLLCVVEPD